MGIWIEKISVEDLNERSLQTLAEHLGIRFIEVGDDYIKASMPIDKRTVQPLGLLHGGASCALGETIASSAANYCVNQKEYYCVGIEINANHIRGVRDGHVIATTRPLHLGRTTQLWEIRVCDEQERLCCVLRHTIAVMSR